MSYLVFKSIHTVAILAWSAGLFYIGRLLVYYVESSVAETQQTLTTMAFRLNRYIITPASIIATLLGLHLAQSIGAFSEPWFHLKSALVIALFGYQHVMAKYIKQMKLGTFNRSSTWCRMANEVPIVLLTGIVFSVITKSVLSGIISMAVIGGLVLGFFLIRRFK